MFDSDASKTCAVYAFYLIQNNLVLKKKTFRVLEYFIH